MNVALLSATLDSTTVAASAKIASPRSAEVTSRCSWRPARACTQPCWSASGTKRSARDGFVCLMSDAGVALEEIAPLVGHRGTIVIEAIYRKQLRPVITEGAEAMDRIFASQDPQKHPRTPTDVDPESDP